MGTEALEDLEAIRQLKYRYLRAVDTKDWALLADTLTEDCVARYGGGVKVYEGRDAILDFLRESLGRDAVHTSHRCSHPEIEVDGDSATGTWALEDRVIDTEFNITLRGAAFYSDRYRLTDGGWRIAETGYRRTFEEIEPRRADTTLTASWWTTDGKTTLGY